MPLKENDIGDQFHYLFVCSHFNSEKKQFLKPYFYKRSNIFKFKVLLWTKNVKLLIKLLDFVKIVMKKISNAN